jgi:hypothetical protein
MMEECFYCGEEASRTDIDRLGKCPSCMEKMTRAAEAAARDSQGYTVGPNGVTMLRVFGPSKLTGIVQLTGYLACSTIFGREPN